jgi:Tc5 transposase DNA-binding domain.
MSKFDKASGLPLAKRAKLDITDAQKQALRTYWSQTYPRPTQRACVDWFQAQFHRQIDRTTVSKILSKYAHLNMGPAGSNKRVLSPQWPILDQKLAEWVEGHISAGYPITGPLIQYKAAEFWKKIPNIAIFQHPFSLMAGLLGSNNATPSDI